MIDLSLFEDLINTKCNFVFFDGQWKSKGELGHLMIELNSQRVKNSAQILSNGLKSGRKYIYDIIEDNLNPDDATKNAIDGIRGLKEDNSPIDSHPMAGQLYEKTLMSFINSTLIKPKVPTYSLSLVSDALTNVLREVTDYNESGYITRVVSTNEYNFRPEYFNNKIKDSNDILTIGDCYKGTLLPIVPEYDEKGHLIGYYSECKAEPIFEDFSIIKSYYTSEFSRVFGKIEPVTKKHRLFSLKIVDESCFPNTIIIPNLHYINARSEMSDTVTIQVLATYKKYGYIEKYGSAYTKEEKYEEYLLWQLNNQIFLNYELKGNCFSYEDLQKIKFDESFRNLLNLYNIASNPDELDIWNFKEGEQNNGLIINKILKIQMVILYN
jgi:hypothetical protein